MKFRHGTLIGISGTIWMCIGIFLLSLGLNFINGATKIFIMSEYPIITFFTPYFGSVDNTAIVLIIFSLILGSLKSRMVFTKVVNKNVQKIVALPNPSSPFALFDMKYIILMGFMMFLGFLMRYFSVPQDLRGMVDIAVGSGLITGSVNYFKQATLLPRTTC